MGPNETSPVAPADDRREGLHQMENGSWSRERQEEEQDASTCAGSAHRRHCVAACHTCEFDPHKEHHLN